VIAVAVLAAGVAAGTAVRPARRGPRRRLRDVLSPVTPGPVPRGSAVPQMGGDVAPSTTGPPLVGSRSVVRSAVAVVGGLPGLAVGVAGAAVAVLAPARTGHTGIEPDDVAVVVDLIAGCLAAGIALPNALDAAAVASGNRLPAACRAVAGALRAGTPPRQAWQWWLDDPWLAPVARTAVRTSATGAAAAADLRRTATRLRARRRATARRRMSQATVWLVVPLGLCFLPAFVLVAVVPMVVGLLPSLH
jgi:hypothetical protein